MHFLSKKKLSTGNGSDIAQPYKLLASKNSRNEDSSFSS